MPMSRDAIRNFISTYGRWEWLYLKDLKKVRLKVYTYTIYFSISYFKILFFATYIREIYWVLHGYKYFKIIHEII